MKKFLKVALACGMIFFNANDAAAAESLKLNLGDAVDLALRNNRTIEQSAEDRESARWGLSAARRSFGPRLTWESGVSKIGGRYYGDARKNRQNFYAMTDEQRANSNNTFADFPPYEAETSNSFSLSMPVYSGGRLESQKKAAEFNLHSADLTLENSRQQVKFETTRAYYQVLQYSDLMTVRQEEMQNLSEHLQTVQIQYEVGTVAMSDVLATNVQLANSRQAYNSAQANYENAVATLNNLIGLPVDTNLVINDGMSYAPFDNDEEFCLEYALEHRPDGIAATYAVKSYEASVSQAKAGKLPSVSAAVSGSFAGEGAFKADHTKERWSAGLQMTWNIFDNNVTSAQVHQAQAAQRKAESAAAERIETIRLEVHNAYTSLRIAEQNIAITESAVSQAQEQYLIAKVRYDEGVDTNLSVMDAQEKLTQARTNYFSALYSYNTSRAQLEKAMGVPIHTDAAIYAAAVADKKNSKKALEISAVSD